MRTFPDVILGWSMLALLVAATLPAPWMFGAWEMWWFWPFCVLLFAATLLFGLRLLVWPRAPAGDDGGPPPAQGCRPRPRLLPAAVLAWLPFLGYAAVRFVQAPVFMDAERSLLLFLTPWLAAVLVVFGTSPRQRLALYVLTTLNLSLLGIYGLVNHAVTGSRYVLWVPGYAQYVAESRATGTYFCPDHFAGLMELACAMGAGLLLAGPRRAAWRLWGAGLVAMGILGVVLSKSRGGGLTLLVMAAAAVAWGFSAWRPERRRLLQGITAAAVLLAVIVAWNLDPAYVRRFKTYFGLHETRTRSLPEIAAELRPRLRDTSRGRMIPAALRAWKTSPWLGVGPGMHQNIWPHVAATPDGDRERGILPSQLNDTFHSYEAHSDWVQLLEEYGLAGLALFLVPVGLGFAVLLRERPRRRTRRTADALRDAALFGALLAAVAMSFHSLGDFNLQIPATAWLLAMLVALPLGGGFRRAQQTVAA